MQCLTRFRTHNNNCLQQSYTIDKFIFLKSYFIAFFGFSNCFIFFLSLQFCTTVPQNLLANTQCWFNPKPIPPNVHIGCQEWLLWQQIAHKGRVFCILCALIFLFVFIVKATIFGWQPITICTFWNFEVLFPTNIKKARNKHNEFKTVWWIIFSFIKESGIEIWNPCG